MIIVSSQTYQKPSSNDLNLVELRRAGTFWYFILTIQNATFPQVRNLFGVIALFISFPWRAAAAESTFLWPLGQGLRASSPFFGKKVAPPSPRGKPPGMVS